MRARGGLAAIICAALALLVVPAAASAARPGYEVRQKGLDLSFELEASNGYKAEVQSEGRLVKLTLLKGATAAYYTVKGHASLGRIDADFGSLGHISGRLAGAAPRPSRRHSKACRGRRPIFERAPFRGSFEFNGEDGYSVIDAHRVEAVGVQAFRQVCKVVHHGKKLNRRVHAGGGHRPGPKFASTILAASAEAAGRKVAFAAIGLEVDLPGGGSKNEPGLFVVAATEEHHEDVAIQRAALLVGVEKGIQISAPKTHPTTATVTLPSPFSGSASLLEESGAPVSWSGDLKVALPGAPEVLLTGPEFQAAFCRAYALSQAKPCEALLEPQESGGPQFQVVSEARLSLLRSLRTPPADLNYPPR